MELIHRRAHLLRDRNEDEDEVGELREWLEVGAARTRALAERLDGGADPAVIARVLDELSGELWAAAGGMVGDDGTDAVEEDARAGARPLRAA